MLTSELSGAGEELSGAGEAPPFPRPQHTPFVDHFLYIFPCLFWEFTKEVIWEIVDNWQTVSKASFLFPQDKVILQIIVKVAICTRI